MPPKKKQARNAFYYFMVEFRQDQEKRGIFYNGMREVANDAGPIWSEMTTAEKEPYNKMAAKIKRQEQEDLTKKFTSLGVSYAELDAEEREQEEARQLMIDTVQSMVRSLNRETSLKTELFFIVHTNYLYQSERGNYFHAELGLAEFNLQFGLTNTFHCFINPGKLELGFRFEATNWAQKTHNIPVDDPNWTGGERDYLKLFKKVLAFLGVNENLRDIPPVFTMPDSQNNNTSISAVKSLFTKMAEAAGQDPALFRIYPLPYLFFYLRNHCVSDRVDDSNINKYLPTVTLADNEIEKDIFSYARNLGCEYHEEKDLATFCSLSIVSRWVFTICDHCCSHLGIRLKPGSHCPEEADVNRSSSRAPETTFQCSTRKTYPVKEAKKDSDPPSKEHTFMPTIIDHGKLREAMATTTTKSESIKPEEVRLPKKHTYSTAMMQNKAEPVPKLNQENFPEMNAPSVSSPSLNPLSDSAFPAFGSRPFGRGRGMQPMGRGDGVQPEPPIWPVSGRGFRRPT